MQQAHLKIRVLLARFTSGNSKIMTPDKLKGRSIDKGRAAPIDWPCAPLRSALVAGCQLKKGRAATCLFVPSRPFL